MSEQVTASNALITESNYLLRDISDIHNFSSECVLLLAFSWIVVDVFGLCPTFAGKQLGNSDVFSCPTGNALEEAVLQLSHFVCKSMRYARRGCGVRDVQPAGHQMRSALKLYRVRGLPCFAAICWQCVSWS